jgi:hypothetical protein
VGEMSVGLSNMGKHVLLLVFSRRQSILYGDYGDTSSVGCESYEK